MLQNNDEGYIKFQCDWRTSKPFPEEDLQQLNYWRQKLYEVNLLGAYPDGIGFGNVSHRANGNQFYISGSKTGNIKVLNEAHYSKVISFDIEQNRVSCEGPIIASSESMSHAVIYQELPEVNAVFHIHHLGIWEKILHLIPTTKVEATYGTPEMAMEIIRLIRKTDVTKEKVLAMAGHQEGLIGFGRTLKEAAKGLLFLVENYK